MIKRVLLFNLSILFASFLGLQAMQDSLSQDTSSQDASRQRGFENVLECISIDELDEIEKDEPLTFKDKIRILKAYLQFKADEAGEHIKAHKLVYGLTTTVVSLAVVAAIYIAIKKHKNKLAGAPTN